MWKFVCVCVVSLAVGACASRGGDASAHGDGIDDQLKAQVTESLSKTFHNFEFDEIRKSEIPGLYEVYSGGRIVYFAPEQSILVFGELYRTDGHSITGDKISAAQALRAKDIDRTAAVVVGNGPMEVVEFVNPDCGYCRAAHQWLKQQQLDQKLKLLVFFMPMQGHPDAQAKAENVICAPPALRQAAYDELWSGKPVDAAGLLKCDGAAKQLADQAKEAVRFGVQGTPTFVVKGQVVSGFRQDQLQNVLLN